MMTDTIVLALAPIFFVILIGYGAGRLAIVGNHHVDGLNALVMSFALPASLFVATASAPRAEMLGQVPLFLILGVVIDVPVTRQDIAEMTGTTLHTVSRAMTGWEARGLVAGGRRKVVVRDPHGLALIAEPRR